MLRYMIMSLFSCCVLLAPAQDKTALNKTVIAAELGAHGAGVAVEWKAAGVFSVETAASYGPSYDVEGFDWLPLLNVLPSYGKAGARFSITPRFYITRQRERRGASGSAHNIEQYFGLTYAYITKSFTPYNPPATLINLHYGLRQQARPRLLFTAYGGIGWGHNRETNFSTLYPALNFKFGYILNK